MAVEILPAENLREYPDITLASPTKATYIRRHSTAGTPQIDLHHNLHSIQPLETVYGTKEKYSLFTTQKVKIRQETQTSTESDTISQHLSPSFVTYHQSPGSSSLLDFKDQPNYQCPSVPFIFPAKNSYAAHLIATGCSPSEPNPRQNALISNNQSDLSQTATTQQATLTTALTLLSAKPHLLPILPQQ